MALGIISAVSQIDVSRPELAANSFHSRLCSAFDFVWHSDDLTSFQHHSIQCGRYEQNSLDFQSSNDQFAIVDDVAVAWSDFAADESNK